MNSNTEYRLGKGRRSKVYNSATKKYENAPVITNRKPKIYQTVMKGSIHPRGITTIG